MNKICTSLEQSQKLIELGIDVDTADMIYTTFYGKVSKNLPMPKEVYDILKYPIDGDKCVPAWSLGTLMGLMPRVGDTFPELCRGKETGLFYMWLDEEFDTQKYSNPIDAAFEMICWLKEQKYI